MDLPTKVVRFNIRVPSEIDVWLSAKAAKNNRSKNGEINNILKQLKETEGQSASKMAK